MSVTTHKAAKPVAGSVKTAGGVAIQTGSTNDARPAVSAGTRMFQRANSLSVGANAGNGRLLDCEFTVRGAFNGGRFLFANYNTAGTQAINAARVAVSGTHLSNGNTLTWSNIKFAGVDTGTIPAATTGIGGNLIPGYLVSDFAAIDSIARADGGTRLIVRVRTHVGDSSLVLNTPSLANIQAIQGAAYNPGFQFGGNVTSALVAAINTTGLSPSEGGGVLQPVDAMMNFTDPTYSLAAFGDSLTEGATTTGAGSGWPVQLGCQAVVAGTKLSAENYGFSGWTHEDYIANARAYIAAGARPSYIATLPYSVNTGGSADASYGACWSRLLTLIELCRANNITPVVLTHPPAQGSVIASIQAQNARVMALPEWVIKVDAYTILDSGSGTLKPEYNPGDGVHWNDAGHAAVAAGVLSQLQATGLA